MWLVKLLTWDEEAEHRAAVIIVVLQPLCQLHDFDSMPSLHGAHMEASYEELDVKVIRAIQPLPLTYSEEVADLIIYLADVFFLGEGILQTTM